jgi:hypothetical protein
MSYMLEFPPSTPTPATALGQPYALFAINDIEYYDELPVKMPVGLALHFAPKLRQYMTSATPIPEDNLEAKSLALRTKYVGFHIIGSNVDVIGLKWMLDRMLQMSPLQISREAFLQEPSILESIFHNTWLALDLHIEGLSGIHQHLFSKLTLSDDGVNFNEIQAIWAAFSPSSGIAQAMGANFVRYHINFGYPREELSKIRHWYRATKERFEFFKAYDDQLATAGSSGTQMRRRVGNTRGLPMERTRARRTRSDDSISSVQTAIWNPQPVSGDAAMEETVRMLEG